MQSFKYVARDANGKIFRGVVQTESRDAAFRKLNDGGLYSLTVEEIGVVIISKAFASQPDGYIQLTLIACEDGGFQLHVRDNAAGFDPFSLATQKLGEDGTVDLDAIGMLMVKKQARSFFYRQYQGFNTLVVSI